MNVLGLDLSLTATGIAYPDGATEVLVPPDDRPSVKGRTRPRTLDDNLARLDWLDNAVERGLIGRHIDLAVVEGYSRGSLARREEAGEIGGLVRLGLWRAGIPIALVTPQQLKVFACNNRAAQKADMAVAAVRIGWEGEGHDAADAFWLRAMGQYRFGDPVLWKRTAYRDEVVAKVTWPELVAAGAAS